MEIETACQDWIALSEHIRRVEESTDFDAFADFIQDSQTLSLATRFLQSLQLWPLRNKKLNSPKVNPRILLAGFMMAKFPHELLDEPEDTMTDEMDKQVLDSARNMVQVITSEPSEPFSAKEAVQGFNQAFMGWKRYDRNRQVERMGRALVEWRMTREFLSRSLPFTSAPEGTRDILGQIEVLIEKTEFRLRQVGGAEAVEESRQREIEVVDLDRLMEQNASEQYWKEFGEEIERNEFHRVVLLLTEISRRLQQLTPSNAEAQEKVKANIDVEFISQMIGSGVFNGEQFVRVFESVWACIKSLQSAAQDHAWEEWKEEVMQSLQDSPSWSELLPNVFNRFLVQLDRIEELAEFYRAQLEE